MGPDELVRLAHVARRYYLDGRTRIEIADELDLSRFKVARMLDRARESGVVKISIEATDTVELELSNELRSHFGLQRAIVVLTPDEQPETIQDRLGKALSDLLSEIVSEGDVLGLTAGRTLTAMAQHLRRVTPCELVQLAGVASNDMHNGVEVMRNVSQATRGRAYPIFAPLLVESPATATALRREHGIVDTFRRFRSVTIAAVAVGSWNPPDSQLYDSAKRLGILDELLEKGVVAEVCSTLLDAEGREVEAIAPRALAIPTDQLRAIPEVIAAAGGIQKTAAIAAAVRSGIVTSLVTDAATARRLLAYARRS